LVSLVCLDAYSIGRVSEKPGRDYEPSALTAERGACTLRQNYAIGDQLPA
jgi:hypothetical protein